MTASEQLVTLAEQRERVGKGDGYDTALARANVETYPRYRRAARACARAGAARPRGAARPLPGRRRRGGRAAHATAPGRRPAGLPSELLERRPDVVAAERRVAAAFYGVEEAKAARLPRIALTASVNDLRATCFVLQDRDKPVWSVGRAACCCRSSTAARCRAQVRIRTAEQKQAVAEYGRIGARAFGEVENALSAEFAAARREDMLGRAVAENEKALGFAQAALQGRLRRPARGVAAAARDATARARALLRVQTEQLVQRVNLYLALGGGFDAAPATTPVAQAKE